MLAQERISHYTTAPPHEEKGAPINFPGVGRVLTLTLLLAGTHAPQYQPETETERTVKHIVGLQRIIVNLNDRGKKENTYRLLRILTADLTTKTYRT